MLVLKDLHAMGGIKADGVRPLVQLLERVRFLKTGIAQL